MAISIKRNVVGNFAGNVWCALMGLAFVPAYIRYLGIESYGLIGIYTTLFAVLGVLELGLGTAFNREAARLSADAGNSHKMRNTLRSLEIVYWLFGLVLTLTIVGISGLIGNHWVKPGGLPRSTVHQAITIMGIVVGLQWPTSLYTGGLMGLQKQGRVNLVISVYATIRGCGALAVLAFWSPTIQAFFLWQAVAVALQTIMLRWQLWSSLGHGTEKPSFDREALREVLKFAGGMSIVSLLSVVAVNTDKIMLSGMLPLKEYGYYILASGLAANLQRLTKPIYHTFFPNLTKAVAAKNSPEISNRFHLGAQLVSVLVLPVAVCIALFPGEILLIWTKNPLIAQNGSAVLALAAISNGLSACMLIPFALTLAYGWLRLSMIMNVIMIPLFVPGMYLSVTKWGMVGAALAWLILNICYFITFPSLMFPRLLKDEGWRWVMADVGKPLLMSFVVAGVFRALKPGNSSLVFDSAYIMSAFLFSGLAAILVFPAIRRPAVHWLGDTSKLLRHCKSN